MLFWDSCLLERQEWPWEKANTSKVSKWYYLFRKAFPHFYFILFYFQPVKKKTKDGMSPEHTLMCHCGCQSPQTLPMLLIFKTNLLIEVLTAFKLSLQGDRVLINPQKQSMMYLFQVSGWLEYENEEHNSADVLKSQQTAISDMGTSCLSLHIKPLNRELHLRSHYTDGSANDLKRGRSSINFDLQARFLTSCMSGIYTSRIFFLFPFGAKSYHTL